MDHGLRGALHFLHHDSQALRGNPHGDPSRREVVVYEPPGVGGTMPTLLALPAFSGSHWGFLNRGWRSESLPMRLERLTREHALPPMRLVMPDTMTALGGGQFLDSPGMGNYSTWIQGELMPWVSTRFPTSSWGAAGKSSGGYGAFRLALDHPGLFGAIAAHAPDCGFEYVYPPDFPGAVESLREAGGVAAWLSDWRGRSGVRGPDHSVANLLAMSCCYSPSADGPLPAELPVDLETGETLPKVLERWLPHDPVRLVQARPDALKGVSVWLDVGTRDEFRLQVGARMLKRALTSAGARLEYREHSGGHFKMNARFEESLVWLARELG